jgi:endonuclease/exonuclease/phosphatase family metal-dependent hydrolase
VWEGGAATRAAAKDSSLKILTWNIERGLRLDSVTAALKQYSPDVALIQEVDWNARRTGSRNVAAELAQSLGMSYRFAAEFVELSQGKPDTPAYHGQATLAALPASGVRAIRFKDQTGYWKPRWFIPGWGIFQRREGGRLALVAELDVAGSRLVAYNVHLESRLSEDLRLRQIKEVLDDTLKYPPNTPMLIAGDLNTRVDSAPAIGALLAAGFRRAVGGKVTTIRGLPLDWVFVRGPVSFTEGTIHNDMRASDHFPLTVRIRLGSEEGQLRVPGN